MFPFTWAACSMPSSGKQIVILANSAPGTSLSPIARNKEALIFQISRSASPFPLPPGSSHCQVMQPVFDEEGRDIIFWVAARGHHTDIGGLEGSPMSVQ